MVGRSLPRPRPLVALVALVCLLVGSAVAPASGAPGGGQSGQVRILRDEYGVPHVYAARLSALFHGVGYAQGQDRLWQADIHRRLATGTLSDLLGPSVLAGDVLARQLFGSQARRAALFAQASPLTRTVLQSFSDGMNAWIAHAEQTDALPAPYAVFGPPRPWTVDDSVATYMYFASFFGTAGGDELDNLTQLEDLSARLGAVQGQRVFADTHWLDDPSAPTTVPTAGSVTPPRRGTAPLPQLPPGTARAATAARGAIDAAVRVFARFGVRRDPASNAIVVGPRLSADRHALLLGGPQMGYSTPQINHEIGIHGAGFDVTGMELAGWPLIPIGVASHHTWTLTSGGTDNTDLYVELVRLRAGATTPEYHYQGQWRTMDCRMEHLVTGEQQLCETIHGPVISPVPTAPTDQATAISIKLAVRGLELQTYDAWLSLGRARTLEQFAAAAARAAYNFNLFYADDRGNIAYWHIGRIPVRPPGDNPFLPHDGTGGNEWQGFLPFSQQPHALNPRQGWLASWNNKPSPGWANSSAGFWDWGPVQRVTTLMHQLRRITPGTATVGTLEQLNRTAGWTTDTPSGSADTVFVSTLLDDLLGHIDRSADTRLPAVVEQLRAWDWLQVDADQDGRYDQPSVAIFNTWWQTLVDQIFGDELPGFDPNVLGNLVARVIGAAPGSLPLAHDYLDGHSVDGAVTAALRSALDELAGRYGPDPGSWLQPVAHISWEALPLTPQVPDTIWMNRGTYNQIVHLGAGRHLWAENVVAPGQSGDPASPHFSDQLALYATWRYKPMRLDLPDLTGHVVSETRLGPSR
jgi:penicillin amidase